MAFIDKYRRTLGILENLGYWNASTNTPILQSGTGQLNSYYVVSVAGSTNLDGETDWNPGDWVVFNGTAWEKNDNTDEVSSVAGKTGAVTLQASDITDFSAAVDGVQLSAFVATKEPTGHENRTQSVVDFDEATRTFSIAPASTSFDIWIAGVKQTISSTLSVQILNTSGNYFFYIDSAGQLQYQASFDLSLFEGKVYTGFVHWNATDGQAVVWGEERHGIVMDGATHSYLHTTRGTQLVSGGAVTYTLGNGSAASDAQIGLGDLRIRDEDILVNIADAATPSAPFEQVLFPIAEIPILYREGSEWKKATATQYPMLVGGSRAKFNEYTGTTWQLTEATANNKTLITYIFATTDFRTPIIGILGQAEYQNLDEAKALGGWDQITFGDLPAQELKLLYIVFYETAASHANAAKSAIVAVSDARFTLDRQVSASSFNGDHSNLSGLSNDDHPQYFNQARGDARYQQLATFAEDAQDAVGGILADTSTINLTYDDAGGTITAAVKAGSIGDSLLASGIDALKIDGGLVTNAEFNTLDGINTGTTIQAQLNGKEPTIASGTTAQYWRGDKTWQTLDKAAVGLGNVDNIAAADLRGRSTHTGNETTLTWSETSEPAAPASGLTVYAETVAGRQMFAQKAKAGGAYAFQPSLGAMRVQVWLPNANVTTSTVWGQAAPTANGTATLRTVATTNTFTWHRRIGYVSAATANQSSGLRSATLQFGTGNAANTGGFFFQTRFGISDAALVANARSAIGLTATTGAFGNADPSTFLNFIGIAHDSADTNWQIMYNDGAGAATKVDLGANFTRSPAVSTQMLDLVLYCAPNSTTIFYEVKNLANGAVASGSFNTNIPANTQLLTWQLWRQNNGTAAAVGLDIASVYIETEN